jgi:hypothetical protein
MQLVARQSCVFDLAVTAGRMNLLDNGVMSFLRTWLPSDGNDIQNHEEVVEHMTRILEGI